MKLIIPAVAAVGLASARSNVKKDCKDLSSMDGMASCLEAIVAGNKKSERSMDKKMQELTEQIENQTRPQVITVEGDYISGASDCEESSASSSSSSSEEESTLMNGVPEFLQTPKNMPDGTDMILWAANDYHYFMNCVDEVEMRIWDDYQNYNAAQWGPAIPNEIPPNPYFRMNPNPGMWAIEQLGNENFEAMVAGGNVFQWVSSGPFFLTAGAHGREMLSWATDDVKAHWRNKNSWYKEEFQQARDYLDKYQEHFIHKFCSALPTFKRIYGYPNREDGCNPDYPYTSWFNEGLNTTAADCDNEFIHNAPKSFDAETTVIRMNENCFDCGMD